MARHLHPVRDDLRRPLRKDGGVLDHLQGTGNIAQADHFNLSASMNVRRAPEDRWRRWVLRYLRHSWGNVGAWCWPNPPEPAPPDSRPPLLGRRAETEWR